MNLNKKIGFWNVFSIAAGAMISSGLFILPAIVYLEIGSSMLLAYFLGALLMLPALISKIELATAMPKTGGTYFFIHRSFGALVGTFAGFASWFSLSLKSSFALLGIGIILKSFINISDETIKFIAIGFVIFFTIINIIGIKESGKLQILLVVSLLIILLVYILTNIKYVKIENFLPLHFKGWNSLFNSVGIIFISFGGLTKIASIAGEIENPKKNIFLGMISAFIIVTLIYLLVLFVTLGIDKSIFLSSLNPIAVGAHKYYGNLGYISISIAAILAFLTTGNAGLLASSRIPFAMSEDNLLPTFLAKINLRFQTPIISILITCFFMIISIYFLNLKDLVKTASLMMLILFFLVNFSLIIMRESKIISYRPSTKSPFYPYLQIIGMIFYLFLIFEMGKLSLLISLGFLIFSFLWFMLYTKSRNKKESALFYIVSKVLSKKIKLNNLTDELKLILLQRDAILEDKFDKLIQKAIFLDIEEKINKERLFDKISKIYSEKFSLSKEYLHEAFKKREEEFSTVISDGLAIPHIIIEGSNKFDVIIIRSKKGIIFKKEDQPVHIIFALIGTLDERNFHLQALMAIAQIIQNADFMKNWKKIENIENLRNLILLAERVRKKKI